MKPEHLTAWALNELSDEDRARIEAAMQESAPLHEQAIDTQAFCSLITQSLSDESAALTEVQRQALLASVQVPQLQVVPAPAPGMNGKQVPAAEVRARRSGWRHPALMGLGALAACWGGYMGIASMAGGTRETVEHPTVAVQEFKVLSVRDREAAEWAKESQAKNSAVASSPLHPTDPKFVRVDDITKIGTGGLKLEGDNTIVVNGGAVVGGKDLMFAPKPSAPASPAGDRKLLASGVTTTTITGSGVVSATGDFDSTFHFDQLEAVPRSTAVMEPAAQPVPVPSTERYAALQENGFADVMREPLSTFGADVDSASFANVRRFLNAGQLPPVDAVRLEELINYFPYHYEAPGQDATQPFSVQVDMAEAPWAPAHRLARIGIKGREIGLERQQANLVFLVDVSGSMEAANKLALVKRSLRMLTEQLQSTDYVSIVTYAGSTEVKLGSTPGKDKAAINAVIDTLQSGGSTHGAAGIQLAYAEAQKHFIKEGVNRVILCTDGDFNVGVSSPESLEVLIKEKAAGGVFLSVLGFGTGNLQDRTMMTLADKGNGNYAYIDSLSEARKVLVEQMNGTLITIAKDVKIQVEFNPALVRSYRLIGYEKRALAKEDFNNDRKDAGEIGAGHTVTALYEVVPVGAPVQEVHPLVDDLKYQPKDQTKDLPTLAAKAPLPRLEGIHDEVMTVKLRYKAPDGELSKLIEVPVKDAKGKLQDAPKDFQFATAVAGFGLLLRDSEHRGSLTWEQVRKLAIQGKGEDPLGYRGEFIQLIDKANGLSGRP